MSKWLWFYALVDQKLGNLLHSFQFEKLTGKGYEEDENKDWAAWVFFASPSDTKIVVDIHLRVSGFYTIRVYMGKHHNLKEWLYPNIRAVTKDVNLWMGWKCPTTDDVKNAFDEIAASLQRYLSEQSKNR
jgi:hypothetical protein